LSLLKVVNEKLEADIGIFPSTKILG